MSDTDKGNSPVNKKKKKKRKENHSGLKENDFCPVKK